MVTTLIKNGHLVTPKGDFKADLLISGETIRAIGENLSAQGIDEVIEAEGLLVVPGGVDAHTHFDLTVGDISVADGWEAASQAAATGGTTTVIEHPSFGPGKCPLDHQLNIYRQRAKPSAIDYSLHGVFQHWNDDLKPALKDLVAQGYQSFKAYFTYEGRLNEEEFLAAAAFLAPWGGLMAVHAENQAIVSHLTHELKSQKNEGPPRYPLSRPDYAESLAVSAAISLAKAAGHAPLYIVHLSSELGLKAVAQAKEEGALVWAETCPQYLLLTQNLYEGDLAETLKFVMAPPLRQQSDIDALWGGIFDGTISVVATDHCGFSWADKKTLARDDIFKCPAGIPGVELRTSLLYSEGVVKRGLSLSRWVQLVSTNPARLFGLKNKGELSLGFDADVVIFNPKCQRTIKGAELASTLDYSPFENIVLEGWPQTVFLRGHKIVDNEVFIGKAGLG
ncbi:MAG: dihydropyrimidinase, partial [Candidatus Adiutrix sp.]